MCFLAACRESRETFWRAINQLDVISDPKGEIPLHQRPPSWIFRACPAVPCSARYFTACIEHPAPPSQQSQIHRSLSISFLPISNCYARRNMSKTSNAERHVHPYLGRCQGQVIFHHATYRLVGIPDEEKRLRQRIATTSTDQQPKPVAAPPEDVIYQR